MKKTTSKILAMLLVIVTLIGVIQLNAFPKKTGLLRRASKKPRRF